MADLERQNLELASRVGESEQLLEEAMSKIQELENAQYGSASGESALTQSIPHNELSVSKEAEFNNQSSYKIKMDDGSHVPGVMK